MWATLQNLELISFVRTILTIFVVCNSNWIEWSAIQGVPVILRQVMSKLCWTLAAQGWFEIIFQAILKDPGAVSGARGKSQQRKVGANESEELLVFSTTFFCQFFSSHRQRSKIYFHQYSYRETAWNNGEPDISFSACHWHVSDVDVHLKFRGVDTGQHDGTDQLLKI